MTREDINDIINAICPNDEDYEKPCISPKYLRQELEQLALDQRQWNEEPTNKNDLEAITKGKKLAKRIRKEFAETGIWAYKVDTINMRLNFEMLDIILKALDQEPTTKNDLGVDCISRQQAIDAFPDLLPNIGYNKKVITEILQKLPSITPIRPKGHWIEERGDYGEIIHWHCSNCYDDSGFMTTCKWDYCPNCGTDMRGEQV